MRETVMMWLRKSNTRSGFDESTIYAYIEG
jgi:hypothetical protein